MRGILDGKVAVVTGSGQGVGRGVALLLAREGARVVTNNRKPRANEASETRFRSSALAGAHPEFTDVETQTLTELNGDANTVAAEIITEGGESIACFGDVSDYDAAGELIQTAVEHFGRIDILVNNAAGLGFGPFSTLSRDDWQYQLRPKLDGAFNTMQHAVPHMISQGYGRVLNAASDAWIGIAALSAYSAANSGVVGLTKSTAKELFRHGITVNAFAPQAESPGHLSFNATLRAMLDAQGVVIADEERMRASEEAHGPADNLTFLAYLASEEASEISGAVFSVTGGGDVALYSEPRHLASITKKGSAWTMAEFRDEVPTKLLADYVSIAKVSEF
ncbi:SDR family NAD(P)-dependent oxidoreductase [Gordonia sp. DT218]|uniref:SDR family NAD(P)-dependent oxidoreductase n=1 Tax=unclassified Gordonia (in: high G+C Gram-positive bacteria) TaxID=2657482 RepID=UPI003CF533C1